MSAGFNVKPNGKRIDIGEILKIPEGLKHIIILGIKRNAFGNFEPKPGTRENRSFGSRAVLTRFLCTNEGLAEGEIFSKFSCNKL
jgi:hypothetical protein